MLLLLFKGSSGATFVDTVVNSVALRTSLNDGPLKDLTLPRMAEVVLANGSRSVLFERVAAR